MTEITVVIGNLHLYRDIDKNIYIGVDFLIIFIS